MSKHSSPALTMRDALYEAPGPKMRTRFASAPPSHSSPWPHSPSWYCSAFM